MTLRYTFGITASLLTTAALHAADLHVPGGYATIQDAVDAAAAGDTIVLAPGTYNEATDLGTKNLRIRGIGSNPTDTVIDSGGLGIDHALDVSGGQNDTTVIENLSFEGQSGLWAPLYVSSGSTPRFVDCSFRFNDVVIELESAGSPSFESCRFIDNGVLPPIDVVDNVVISFTDCFFADNRGNMAGVIDIIGDNAEVTIDACTFTGGYGAFRGGAVALQADSTLTISNSLFHHNEGGNGGAVFADNGTVDIRSCTFADNDGGFSTGSVDVNAPATLDMVNCIVMDADDPPVTGTGTLSVNFSLVQGGFAGTGNIDGNPLFVHRPSGNYRLLAGSPCLDAGSDFGLAGLTHDLDGKTREVDEGNMTDTGVGLAPITDMGCYENQATTRYVNIDATGANTGLSWDDAYTDLNDALFETYVSEIDQVWVAAGVYKPDSGSGDRARVFLIADDLEVLGGFDGTELVSTARDHEANQCVLSGAIGSPFDDSDNSYTVLGGSISTNSMISGFTIRHANSDDAVNRDGGGVYVSGAGQLRIEDCWIRDNDADGHGAGLYASADTILINCRFSGNDAGERGGAIMVIDSDVTVSNCLIHGNTAGDEGGAMSVLIGGDVNVRSSSIWGNTAGGFAGGIEGAFGDIEIGSSIVWHNSGDQLFGGGFNVVHSSIEGWDGTHAGTGAIGHDPKFIDPDGADDVYGTSDDDARLSPNSRCIDAGVNGHVQYVTVDAIGLPRFADDAGMVDRGVGGAPVVDMGAYEFPGTSCPADITGDGTVDVSDMLALLGKWGLCDLCDADINVDGIVDVTDMLMLLGAWGDCP